MRSTRKSETVLSLFDDEVLNAAHYDIAVHEGVVFSIYEDHLGNRTFGIGHLITPKDPEWFMAVGAAVDEDRVTSVFQEDFKTAVETALILVHQLYTYPPDVQRVLINMAFNLGYSRLKGFKRMLKAVKQGNYQLAADEMLDSRWAKQVPRRAKELADMMRGAAV